MNGRKYILVVGGPSNAKKPFRTVQTTLSLLYADAVHQFTTHLHVYL